ncbi:MAG: helix-turn-helix transcriptional regulator [Alphaproteobacteria bacterium]|nr:helix-turn-helix transcriptional regulator [Alphaproteobacteria bacterium]
MDTTTLARRLRAARTKARLSQSQLATAVGRTAPAVTQWESLKKPTAPDTDTLRRVAETLRVEFDWLAFGLGPMDRGLYRQDPQLLPMGAADGGLGQGPDENAELPRILADAASVLRQMGRPVAADLLERLPATPPDHGSIPADDNFFATVFEAVKSLHDREKAPLPDRELASAVFLEYQDITATAATASEREDLLKLALSRRARLIREWRKKR